MNIDDVMRTSVHALARGVTPPAADPDMARARARGARRRQRAIAAGGVAAVTLAGVTITSGLWDQGTTTSVTSPSPTAPLALQTNESAVWSEANALHIGSRKLAVPLETVFGFGLVDGGVVYSTDARNADVLFQPLDGGRPTRIGESAQLAPVGDPASGLAAWFEEVDKAGSLVVYDTESGQEVARTSVPPALRPQDNILFPGTSLVIAVSSTAIYYHARENEIWVYRWQEGGEPELISKTKEQHFDVAGGVTAQAAGERGSVRFVTAEGTALATDLPQGGSLNPDGTLFASGGSLGNGLRVVLTDTSTGEPTELELFGSGGERGLPFAVGWSSRDTLMVKSITLNQSRRGGLRSQVLACTVPTGECGVVADVKKGFFVTVPSS